MADSESSVSAHYSVIVTAVMLGAISGTPAGYI